MHPEPRGVPLPALGLGAGAVARALATGWARARPDDLLTLLPLPDGGPGSARAVAPARVRSHRVLAAPGPLGDPREADLIRLEPAAGPGAPERRPAARAWFLDAARLAGLPEDRAVAAREVLEGTTGGLGLATAQALRLTRPGDSLVIGLARSAVHDGGAGLLDALGGASAARGLMEGRDVVLALADGVSLGGMSGAGQALSGLTGLAPEQAQETDRAVCATASRLVTGLDGPRPGAPALLAGQQPRERRLAVSSWGTGAGGGAAMVLRALGARALPGARVMARLLGVEAEAGAQDLLVTAQGEAYDVLADSVPVVVGQAAVRSALPAVLVTGRSLVPRGELAEAGIVSLAPLQAAAADPAWDEGGPQALVGRLEAMGERLARTWSR
ncbi:MULTISPECIES: glycerate kinase [unclassified Actinomyces]|uniref:glycerate kinase n=2 Tax=Actinomyces TaxID=1654 RepID=UPI0020179159|nr:MULTISPECIES: glycerate kinase [unclassified Actinomyces]